MSFSSTPSTMSSFPSAFGQSSSIPSSNFSGSASVCWCTSPFPSRQTCTLPSTIFSFPLRPPTGNTPTGGRCCQDKSKIDASACKESKQQHKLQCDEMEKSVQLICKDITRHQEDMKSWIERYRSLELEKIEDTKTIKQLREEIAQLTKSKDAIIAEYLESPAFTKRLDEEHQKRLSEIFHPCFVKKLGTVQTKLPDTVQTKVPDTVQTKLPDSYSDLELNSILHGSCYYAYKEEQEERKKKKAAMLI